MHILLPPFELKNICGRGGMAEVWRAVHVEQQIAVAVKVMTTDHAQGRRFRDAFQNEVRAVARLHHPSVVTVLDFGVIDEKAEAASGGRLRAGAPFLAMEYASGGTLARVKKPLEFAPILEILLALLDALAHAHARGVLHRDIKPQNILLPGPTDLRRSLKLTDFGIAHPMEEDYSVDNENESSGTPQFMAPEQFFARWRDYGPWTDLYALGCIAYELASGELPFVGGNYAELAIRHVKETVPELKPKHVMPAGFVEWVLRLLEKNPRERFQRAADASWALTELSKGASLPEEGSAPTLLDLGEPPRGEDVAETVITHYGSTGDDGATLPWAARTLTTDAWRELQQMKTKRTTVTPTAVHRIPPMAEDWRRAGNDAPTAEAAGGRVGALRASLDPHRGPRS